MSLPESFYKGHITFTAVDALKSLIKPLERIGITYFTYDKNYDDGSHIRLTTHGDWIETYYRQELYNKAIFEKDIQLFCTGHVFWSWLNREPIYSAASQHDIDHGITITQKQENSCDFYHFGARRNNPLPPDFIANNLPLLYRFIDYFREQAADLIHTAEDTRITLEDRREELIQLPEKISVQTSGNNFVNFLNKIEVKRLYLGEKFDNAYLTRREIDIVRLLMIGRTAVDIAQALHLSSRTLEVHISHIKEKFKCATLFELGFMLGSLGPKSLYPFKITN